MNALILLVGLLGQTAPPLVAAEDAIRGAPTAQAAPTSESAPEVVVATDEFDAASRSAWRIHVSAGAGFLAFTGAGAAGPSNPGGFVSFGKPLYVATRHRHHQWVTDSTVFFGYSPQSRTAVLVMTPTIGTNWYFGPYIGLEWRGGVGFGATPGNKTNVGLGVSVEGSLVLRPFKDDRQRIKLQAQEAVTYGFIGGMTTQVTLGVGLAYETAI